MWRSAFKFCFQVQLAPLQPGFRNELYSRATGPGTTSEAAKEHTTVMHAMSGVRPCVFSLLAHCISSDILVFLLVLLLVLLLLVLLLLLLLLLFLLLRLLLRPGII